jgi:hypothetical protein
MRLYARRCLKALDERLLPCSQKNVVRTNYNSRTINRSLATNLQNLLCSGSEPENQLKLGACSHKNNSMVMQCCQIT